MHFLFIDESGNPSPPGKSGPVHFVLGGVIIPEEIWPKLNDDLKRIKSNYQVNGEIKWRYFVPNNCKLENSLRHLSAACRDQLRIDLFAALGRYRSVRIISVIANVVRAYMDPKIGNEEALYHRSYKVLTERFQYFLQDLERTSGQRINGLVVCDHRNSRQDSRLRSLHQALLTGYDQFKSNYKNIIEGLFLAPSHFSVGIQFADLVAGAIFRKYSHGDDRFFSIVKPLIRTGPDGGMEGYGLIRVPSKW